MRKIIETGCTLLLWAIWIIGSGLTISDFFLKAAVAKKITHHLFIISWSPVIAITIFAVMLIAVRSSKVATEKTAIPNEHNVPWSAADLLNAKNGKIVDLHFEGAGLACQVVARNEVASALHAENQTVYVTIASRTADESVRALVTNSL